MKYLRGKHGITARDEVVMRDVGPRFGCNFLGLRRPPVVISHSSSSSAVDVQLLDLTISCCMNWLSAPHLWRRAVNPTGRVQLVCLEDQSIHGHITILSIKIGESRENSSLHRFGCYDQRAEQADEEGRWMMLTCLANPGIGITQDGLNQRYFRLDPAGRLPKHVRPV